MICLYVKAPFAAFREFSAGYYRKTAPFIPPSAAYGLLLNIAGIETRCPVPEGTTEIRDDLPLVELAIGAIRLPRAAQLYQQLHNLPVGKDKDYETKIRRSKGTKCNIQPVRRELLTGIEAYVCARGNPEVEAGIRKGLRLGARRPTSGGRAYGLPFLGDNNFLIDVLKEVAELGPAHWLVRTEIRQPPPGPAAALFTVWIHRTDSARTVRVPMALLPEPQREIPAESWVTVGPAAVPEGASHGRP
jgi:CRISPR-associated protein Cas5t